MNNLINNHLSNFIFYASYEKFSEVFMSFLTNRRKHFLPSVVALQAFVSTLKESNF